MATTLGKISIKDSSSWNTFLNLIYPVGSYYLANTATSPGSRFGGTWTQITGQRFLCGHSSAGTGGGNTHTLTVNQMPSHDHALSSNNAHAGWTGTSPGRFLAWSERSLYEGWGGEYEKFYKTPDGLDLMSNTGGGQRTTTCPSIETVICGIALRKLFTSKGGE